MCYGSGCPHENSWGECRIGSRAETECPIYGTPEADEYDFFTDDDRLYDEMVEEEAIESMENEGNGKD